MSEIAQKQSDDETAGAGAGAAAAAAAAAPSKEEKEEEEAPPVCWFIFSRKLAALTRAQFLHEFETVHARLTLAGAARDSSRALRAYTQIVHDAALTTTRTATTTPATATVGSGGAGASASTRAFDVGVALSWVSARAVLGMLRDPGYRKHAGAHVFAEAQGQVCSLTRLRATVPEEGRAPEFEAGAALYRVVLIWLRASEAEADADSSSSSPAGAALCEERLEWARRRKTSSAAAGFLRYRQFLDATPADMGRCVEGTPFELARWDAVDLIEQFDFGTAEAVECFFAENGDEMVDMKDSRVVVVGGRANRVLGSD